DSIWSSINGEMSRLQNKFGRDRRKAMDLFVSIVRRMDRPVVYVFDEARVLSTTYRSLSPNNTLFRYLRRALGSSPKDSTHGCCGMFLDTSSKLSMFLPVRAQDPSLRYLRTSDAPNLERPFYLIDTFDELARDAGSAPECMNDFCDAGFLTRFGRPMWVTQT